MKEAVEKSANLNELYKALAVHIDSDDERQAFLKSIER